MTGRSTRKNDDGVLPGFRDGPTPASQVSSPLISVGLPGNVQLPAPPG
jgi:hypothetical protein